MIVETKYSQRREETQFEKVTSRKILQAGEDTHTHTHTHTHTLVGVFPFCFVKVIH